MGKFARDLSPPPNSLLQDPPIEPTATPPSAPNVTSTFPGLESKSETVNPKFTHSHELTASGRDIVPKPHPPPPSPPPPPSSGSSSHGESSPLPSSLRTTEDRPTGGASMHSLIPLGSRWLTGSLPAYAY